MASIYLSNVTTGGVLASGQVMTANFTLSPIISIRNRRLYVSFESDSNTHVGNFFIDTTTDPSDDSTWRPTSFKDFAGNTVFFIAAANGSALSAVAEMDSAASYARVRYEAASGTGTCDVKCVTARRGT